MRRLIAMLVMAVGLLAITSAPSAVAGSKVIGRIKGTGQTWTLPAYRRAKQIAASALKAEIGATGRLTCPWGTATAFLVGAGDTFVTSAHVFINLEAPDAKSGKGRKAKHKAIGVRLGAPGRCRLRFLLDNAVYRIADKSLRFGVAGEAPDQAISPLTASLWPMPDWAVGRLDRSAKNIEPYGISTSPLEPGARVAVISQGMADYTPRVCHGVVAGFLGIGEGASFTTSCDVGLGASGGPVLVDGQVIGLTRGWIDLNGDGRLRQHLGVPIDQRLISSLYPLPPPVVPAVQPKTRRKIVSTSRK